MSYTTIKNNNVALALDMRDLHNECAILKLSSDAENNKSGVRILAKNVGDAHNA